MANRPTNITWTATDASGIASIDIYVSLDNGATYQQIARGLANSGTYSWVPADRPTTQARIKVVATDAYGNSNNDVSDAVFTIVSPPFTNAHGVASTLRDFDMPGTQPFEHGPDLDSSASCATCHGGYDQAVEPHFNWQGSMMAHASRDPLFKANMAIANQDAAELRRPVPALPLAARLAGGPLRAHRRQPDGGRGRRWGDLRAVSPHGGPGLHRRASVRPTISPSSPRCRFPGTNYGNGMFVIDPTGLAARALHQCRRWATIRSARRSIARRRSAARATT